MPYSTAMATESALGFNRGFVMVPLLMLRSVIVA